MMRWDRWRWAVGTGCLVFAVGCGKAAGGGGGEITTGGSETGGTGGTVTLSSGGTGASGAGGMAGGTAAGGTAAGGAAPTGGLPGTGGLELLDTPAEVDEGLAPALAWAEPVAFPDHDSGDVGLTTSTDGTATLILHGVPGLVVDYSASTGWGQQTEIDASIGTVRIAGDPTTGAILAWKRGEEMKFAIDVDSVLSSPLSTPMESFAPEHLEVAGCPNGDAVAIWSLNSGGTYARLFKGGAWEPEATLQEAPGDAFTRVPRVSMDVQGRVMVVWEESDGGDNFYVRRGMVSFHDGTAWSSPIAYMPHIDGNTVGTPDGRLGASGQGFVGGIRDNQVLVYAVDVATGVGAETRLDEGDFIESGLTIAVGPSGHAIAMWKSSEPYEYIYDYLASLYDPTTGTWSSPQKVYTTTHVGTRARIAIDEAGRAVAVWNETALGDPIVAVHYAPASGWGNPVLLQYQPEGGNLARVGITSGTAYAAWSTAADESTDTVWITHATLP